MLIHGSCHCRNIELSLALQPAPAEIRASACSCSFCTKHGATWTAHPSGALKVHVSEPELVSKYDFATKTAQFHICAKCGVVPVVISQIEGRLYAVVNVNALEGVDRSFFRHASVSFDYESKEARIARRKRHWIANVEYVESGTFELNKSLE